jgi:hypothetical protein
MLNSSLLCQSSLSALQTREGKTYGYRDMPLTVLGLVGGGLKGGEGGPDEGGGAYMARVPFPGLAVRTDTALELIVTRNPTHGVYCGDVDVPQTSGWLVFGI